MYMTDHEPTSEKISFEEIERRSTARKAASRAANRAKYFGVLPSEALLWMALAPSWTLELALSCNFPVGGEDTSKVFNLMVEANMVEVSRPIFIETFSHVPTTYTMNETFRAEVLVEYRDRPEKLRDTLTIIGQGMLSASEGTQANASIPPLLPHIRKWALLA